MIPHKEYLMVKEWADKLKLPTDNNAMRSYCKLLTQYVEFKQPEQVKEIQKLKLKVLDKCIPYGHITIDKKILEGHINVCQHTLRNIDAIMKEDEIVDRGKKIAKQWNILNISSQSLDHYGLKTPLKNVADHFKQPIDNPTQ